MISLELLCDTTATAQQQVQRKRGGAAEAMKRACNEEQVSEALPISSETNSVELPPTARAPRWASMCVYIYLADVGDIQVLNFSCKDPLRDTSCMNIPTQLELIFGRDTIE